MKKVLAVCLYVSSSCFAQTASREKVLQLYNALQVRSGMQLMVGTVEEQIVPSVMNTMQQREGMTFSDEDAQYLRDMLSKRVSASFSGPVMTQMLDAMVPVYQKYFTDQDIDNIIGFYRTPTGKKFISEQNELLRDGMQAAQPIMIAQMNRTMEDLQKEVADYMQKRHPRPQSTPKVKTPASKS